MKRHYKIIFAFLLALPFFGCESDDDALVDLEQVQAPANLGATFQITQDNSGLVEITPTGEGAAVYTVDFGDGSTPAEGIKVGDAVVLRDGSTSKVKLIDKVRCEPVRMYNFTMKDRTHSTFVADGVLLEGLNEWTGGFMKWMNKMMDTKTVD